jgi:hypothetical protein
VADADLAQRFFGSYPVTDEQRIEDFRESRVLLRPNRHLMSEWGNGGGHAQSLRPPGRLKQSKQAGWGWCTGGPRPARQAYADFGKGSGHHAGLNFGDCLSYALALDTREPLLWKGDAFGHTGIASALTR